MKNPIIKMTGAAIAALCLYSCSGTTLSGLAPKDFESVTDGKTTALYTLTNESGMEVCITNFGGRIVSIMVPDRNGVMTDVVLGFDNIEDYKTHASDFGAAIGRYANRIGNARFTLDGTEYVLDANDGENCLHGGSEGWQYQVYEAEQTGPSTLVLSMDSPAGEMGFPGNVEAKVIYRLTEDNAIDITFEGTSDSPTVFGMTSHSYFNLSGNHAEPGTGQILYINADTYTPVNESLIPTGEILPVEGTPMDFRAPKAVQEDIEADYEQLRRGNGYDHNWILNTDGDLNIPAASLYSPESGIMVETYTDQPGIQIYSGNFLDGKTAGKHGVFYPKRASVCLETQIFPDSPNRPEWPGSVLRPEETYSHRCIYRFSVVE